jgi:heptosyltransferase-2
MIQLLLFVMLPTWLAIGWRRLVPNPLPQRRGQPIRSIIVFRLDQLGDLVLTTPLFRELKRLYPDAHITVVIPSRYKSLFTTNRNVDEIFPLHELGGKWLSPRARTLASAVWFYWTRLRKRQFDLAISPRFDLDESLATLLCALTHAGRRVGHSSHASVAKARVNRGFDAAFETLIPPSPLSHELDRNLEAITALGGSVKDRHLDIPLTENDRRFASELLKHLDPQSFLIALGIGGRAAGRRWPLDRYAECVARLNQQFRIQPIIVCSAEEDAAANELSMKLPVPPYILSRLPLRTVCAVLERCDLFVGNDTGTAHLAAAVDCTTIVICRHPATADPAHPNSPARFAPQCNRCNVLQPRTGRDDCAAFCRQPVPHCILEVTVEEVVNAAIRLLAQCSVLVDPPLLAKSTLLNPISSDKHLQSVMNTSQYL